MKGKNQSNLSRSTRCIKTFFFFIFTVNKKTTPPWLEIKWQSKARRYRREQLIRDYSRLQEKRDWPDRKVTYGNTYGVGVRNKTELPLEGGQIEYGFLIVTAQHDRGIAVSEIRYVMRCRASMRRRSPRSGLIKWR